MKRDRAPTSKSTVMTARSEPAGSYTGSVQVRPVLFDEKNTRGAVQPRARAATACV